ncbi:hypothetical protein N7539_009586 [Penicillium diatomitis]|uniref:Uncharacterized protein n=1 Tax=Penicillium diatomitis TaxID=2819901 RepID=A0A9X0BJ12_9EURO|nr:uncharacterized protein N7539_009586 [Penicillium diatomitis]KAJ5466630.1 hypothetical protein N7539_009586 [Penicillium diatomitis]
MHGAAESIFAAQSRDLRDDNSARLVWSALSPNIVPEHAATQVPLSSRGARPINKYCGLGASLTQSNLRHTELKSPDWSSKDSGSNKIDVQQRSMEQAANSANQLKETNTPLPAGS